MIASPTKVRRATPADTADVASILTQGFYSDPVFEWVFPDPATRRQYLSEFFRIFSGATIPAGDTFIDVDRGSAAVWLPVDPANPTEDDPEIGEQMAIAAGPYAERLFVVDSLMKAVHPHHAEHSYLNVVSTIPSRQGTGLGRAIISERVRELDAAGLAGYLEATTLRSAKLYESLGFVRLGHTIDLPDGPSMYPMWRDPQG